MVQVSKMLLGLAAMLSTATADKAPAFALPTFDYAQLSSSSTPDALLTALKTDGIISIRNVPSYTQVRKKYLDQAAACAVAARQVNAEFLINKTLSDGTQRFTISSRSGQDLDASDSTTDAACPGYAAVYREFSSLLEWVVIGVATTLDATSFSTADGLGQAVTNRKLVSEAVRLDHFHAYETPAGGDDVRRMLATGEAATESDLSLELHEDDGMFIAFPTPAFYKVDDASGKLTLVEVDDATETGLVIQTHDGQRVRPVLEADAVTLMVGTGYSQWVTASEALPAVMHGMRMPELPTVDRARERLLRAWFGKMTLLPAHQRMLSQLSFDEHANTTTRYVNEAHAADRMLLGCAPRRKLVASAADECAYKACSVKSGATAPSEGCDVVCNRSHSGDAAACSASCDCSVSSHSATTCWMLCVLDLDACELADQSCSGQAKVCTSTPKPTTSAPAVTPSPPTATTTAPSPTATSATPSSPATTTGAPATGATQAPTQTPETGAEAPSTSTEAPEQTQSPATGGAC